MKTFSISASKIANICGKNYHVGEEAYRMVDILWEQLDPAGFRTAFSRDLRLAPSSPIKSPIPDDIRKMCKEAHRELEKVPEADYLRCLIQKREDLWGKVNSLMANESAEQRSVIASFVGANMNGSYGCKSEDKIVEIYESLTAHTVDRRVYKTSRDYHFQLNGETIKMVVFGTPDGFSHQDTDTFRILECKAKMGSDAPNERMIKDYLQAITYQMIYGSSNFPCKTILLSHFESVRTEDHPKLLRIEDRVLSEWFMKSAIEADWNELHGLDKPMVVGTSSEIVQMQSENQAGLLRILHISLDDARRVWDQVLARIRLLLLIVLSIIDDEEWQKGWVSTDNKDRFFKDAMLLFSTIHV